MAKPLEDCVFCGENPCTCYGTVKKKSTVRVRTPTVPVSEDRTEVTPVQSAEDVDFGSIPEAKSKFAGVHSQHVEKDLSYVNALRALREIVTPREQRWIDSQISPPLQQELDKRVAEWRSRNVRSL